MDLVWHGAAAAAAVLATPGAVAGAAEGRAERKAHGVVGLVCVLCALILDEIFRRECQRVVGVAARVLGPRDLGEDVAQDVFLSFGRSSVPAGEARGRRCVAATHTALILLRSGRRRASRDDTTAAVDGAIVADVPRRC